MAGPYSTTLSCIFPISRKLRRCDQRQGFKLVDSEISSDFKQIMKDLFNDPRGEYFVNGSEYADISLYLLNSMTEGSE